MQNNRKKDMILDAMQRLMNQTSAQSISVSDVAKEAGIGKGSIYYYFKSKEEILEAVIERSYSAAIEKAKNLLDATDMDALTKNGSHFPHLPGVFHGTSPPGVKQLL